MVAGPVPALDDNMALLVVGVAVRCATAEIVKPELLTLKPVSVTVNQFAELVTMQTGTTEVWHPTEWA